MRDARSSDSWKHGALYESFMGRWSRLIPPSFLSWLGIPAGRRWLDLGCGTGVLCAAIADQCEPAAVYGVEPSEGFLETARDVLGDHVALFQGSATAIPLDAASVDVVVSGLVLNFVPNPCAALAEMRRVTSEPGAVAAYVWDYADRMELLRHFWDAAVDLEPSAAILDEAVRFPLCRPDRLEDLFASSGLADVEVRSIDVPTIFRDFEDYWQPFLGGQGPAPTYVSSLTDVAKMKLRDRVEARLPKRTDGTIALVARAWAVRGTVAAS